MVTAIGDAGALLPPQAISKEVKKNPAARPTPRTTWERTISASSEMILRVLRFLCLPAHNATAKNLVAGLRSDGLHILDPHLRNAMSVHFFDGKPLPTVVAGVADCRDFLQTGEHKPGKRLKTGVARQQQIILRLKVAKPNCAVEYQRLAPRLC